MLLGLVLTPSAEACSVPVFRWALERWQADHYELLVFREKSLSEADQAKIQILEQRVTDAKALVNLQVRDIDVTQPIDEPYAAIWKKAQGGPLPMCFLMYPRGAHVSTPVWSGSLSELLLEALLDSPARRELARRILGGQSGVWLLLRSGDRAKDNAAAQLLSEEIDRANKTLRLPDMTGDEILEGPDPPDISNLRVEFSLLEVNREDPAERMLVRMLLGTEPDLRGYPDTMAFPVYGRGRVLYALVGQGIHAGTIIKANAFLVGRCACEIKAENPGTDLLMPVDWQKGIGDNTAVRTVELPPLPGIVSVNAGSSKTAPEPALAAYGLVRNAIIAVVAAVALVTLVTCVLIYRRRDG
jgi:hypothetical protein